MIRASDTYREQARLLSSRARERRGSRSEPLPSTAAVAALVESVRALLFAHAVEAAEHEEVQLEARLWRLEELLADQIRLALRAEGGARDGVSEARELARRFVERLPDLQAKLWSDAQAAHDGDPSLHSIDEAILCFPGIAALICHRLAHLLFTLDVPIVPRMMAEHAHSATGIDIHPGARIGERLFIDHGTGVVIGETAVIGDRVRLYQGVTLGTRSFPVAPDGRLVKGEPRHPILEDEVVVYSGATILGRITIGRGAVIGGNVWVTHDVPPHTLLTQAKGTASVFSHGSGI